MRTLIAAVVFSLAFAGSANAKSKASAECSDSAAVTKAAENSFRASDEASGDNPRFIMRTKDLDRWEVDMVYHDQCYRTVSVYMKAGTCTVDHIKKGEETCTDE